MIYDKIISMKITMVAGGTGGHIYPALTLAEGLVARGHEVSFIGSADRMEHKIIPEHGYKYDAIEVLSTRGSLIKKAKSLCSLIKAYFVCLRLLKGRDMVIGFGNYISVPVALAAHHLGLKLVLHEQNSFVGRANRMLEKYADLVIGSYQENLQQFHNPHTLILGNPQSSKVGDVRKSPDVLREMDLDPNKKTVVIFMGSLGSDSVNDILMDYFKELDGSYQVIYATGSSNYAMVKKAVPDKEYLKIYERINGIEVMANTDLLVSRAGATTLAEVMALGVAAILIPSPFVPNNHQYYNGMALCKNEAALMIEEKDLSVTGLKKMIEELLMDDKKRHKLAENASKMANRQVLGDIIEEIEKL